MSSLDIRVIKIGGSLLEQSELPTRFRRWLSRQPAARNVLIVGGGKLVDAVRELDRTFKLDATTTHWAAVDCMSITVRLIADLLPEAELAAEWSGLRRRLLHMLANGHAGMLAFDVVGFLKQIEGSLPGAVLSHGWQVTSDSIAARLAVALAAGELVLLKSSLPRGQHPTPAELSESGYVDEFFPTVAPGLRAMRCVELPSEKSLGIEEVIVQLNGK